MDEAKRLGQMDLEAAFEEIWKIIEGGWDEQGVAQSERERQVRAFEAKLMRLYQQSHDH